MIAYLLCLPEDVLLYLINESLDLPSILKIRQSCKYLYQISHAKLLWINLYKREVVAKNLPYAPCWKQVDHLEPLQLQQLVLHTLRLEHRRQTRSFPLQKALDQKRSITWTRLLQGEWLLVASSDDITSALTLWSVEEILTSDEESPIVPLAEAFLPAPVINGCIDIQESVVHIALELRGRTCQVDILSIVGKRDNYPKIHRLQTIDDVAHLRFLEGDYVGVALVNDASVVGLLDWRTNSIENLHRYSDKHGGAIAMHRGDGWIAVIRKQFLEIYTPHENSFELRESLDIPGYADVGTAMFSSSLFPPRLCITSSLGVFIYEVICDVKSWRTSLIPLWAYECDTVVESGERLGVMASRGQLGCNGDSFSCLYGKELLSVEFLAVRFLLDSTEVSTVSLNHPGMPALHALGVFTYDEARGILVLGNAYGELSVFDFSRSDPKIFRDLLKTPMRCDLLKDHGTPLPSNEVVSYPGPPFPYINRPEHVERDIIAFWESQRPAIIPEGWIAAVDAPFVHGLTGLTLAPGTAARTLEYAAHIYGRQVPLLYRYDSGNNISVITRVGEQLYVLHERYDETYTIADEGVTLQELADSISKPEWEYILAGGLGHSWSETEVIMRYPKCGWDSGSDRRERLRERGGRVIHEVKGRI